MKKVIIIVFGLIYLFSLTACNKTLKQQNNINNKNRKIVWNEITKDGVNEELLIKNLDEKHLKYIATKLQKLTKILEDKGLADKNYWYGTQWYKDVKDSKEFKEVIYMKEDAIKPLYLIIYKSQNQGLYEYICAMALDKVFGYDFSKENDGSGWKNSKELLKFINNIILEKDRK